MEQSDLNLLGGSPLFAGISPDELPLLLKCLSVTIRGYGKNEFIFTHGDRVSFIGLVLEGSVQIIRENYWGSRSILSQMGPAELFAEAFSCAGVPTLEVSALAVQPCRILLMDYKKVITTCPSSCGFHSQLVQNMIRILAMKNIMLTQKMGHITMRSTREKVLSYLSARALEAGSGRFAIPFNRQELADYLSVDRSALSAELSKMKDEGILSYHKNQFELFRPLGHD